MVKQGFLEVRSGLKQGHQVVIFGQDALRDGDIVDADWKTWAQRDDLRAKEAEEANALHQPEDVADEPEVEGVESHDEGEPAGVASKDPSERGTASLLEVE